MRKLTLEEVELGFKSRSWKLLSKSYYGSQKPLNVICNQGHETTISWNNFKKGQGCNKCAGNQKLNISEVEKEFAKAGFQLLDTNYVNNNIPLRCRCVCGNVTKMPLCTVKNGTTCLKCKPKKISQSLTTSKEEIIDICKSKGFEYIDHWLQKETSINSKKNRVRLKYRCKCGNEAEAWIYNFKQSPGCWECGKKKKSGDKCYLWNPDRDQIALNKQLQKRCWSIVGRVLSKFDQVKNDYKINILDYSINDLSDHIKSHELFNPDIEYHIDHIFPVNLFVKYGIDDMKIINKLTNLRPLYSGINLSKGAQTYEPAFESWLNQSDRMAEDVIWECIQNDFKLENLNAELILPKLASESGFYQKMYYNMLNNGEKKMFVHSYEWIRRREQIKHRCQVLKDYKGIKIGARQCSIEEINKQELRAFCDYYHVQGGNNLSKISFGLKYQNNLLGIISLGSHHRGGDQLVLDRLCYKHNCHISGGSEKLLKRAIEWSKLNNYKEIITFSDRRYTSGDVYERLGFIKEKSYNCDYSYVLKTDPLIHFTKQSQMKSSTKCPKDTTELEWANNRGLLRIWDCGKDRWILKF